MSSSGGGGGPAVVIYARKSQPKIEEIPQGQIQVIPEHEGDEHEHDLALGGAQVMPIEMEMDQEWGQEEQEGEESVFGQLTPLIPPVITPPEEEETTVPVPVPAPVPQGVVVDGVGDILQNGEKTSSNVLKTEEKVPPLKILAVKRQVKEEDKPTDSRILNAALTAMSNASSASAQINNAISSNNGQIKMNGREKEKIPEMRNGFRPADPIPIPVEERDNKRKQWKCADCPKSFPNEQVLQAHRSLVHSDQKFQCPYCSKSFQLQTSLEQHEKTHSLPEKKRAYATMAATMGGSGSGNGVSGKTLSCDKCGMTFHLVESKEMHCQSCTGKSATGKRGKRVGSMPAAPATTTITPTNTTLGQGQRSSTGDIGLPLKKRGRPAKNPPSAEKPPLKLVIKKMKSAVASSITPTPSTPIKKIINGTPTTTPTSTPPHGQAAGGRSQRVRHPPKWLVDDNLVVEGNVTVTTTPNKQQETVAPTSTTASPLPLGTVGTGGRKRKAGPEEKMEKVKRSAPGIDAAISTPTPIPMQEEKYVIKDKPIIKDPVPVSGEGSLSASAGNEDKKEETEKAELDMPKLKAEAIPTPIPVQQQQQQSVPISSGSNLKVGPIPPTLPPITGPTTRRKWQEEMHPPPPEKEVDEKEKVKKEVKVSLPRLKQAPQEKEKEKVEPLLPAKALEDKDKDKIQQQQPGQRKLRWLREDYPKKTPSITTAKSHSEKSGDEPTPKLTPQPKALPSLEKISLPKLTQAPPLSPEKGKALSTNTSGSIPVLAVNGSVSTQERKGFVGMPKLLNQAGLPITPVIEENSDDSSEDDEGEKDESPNSKGFIKDAVVRFLDKKISNRNMLRIREELLALKKSGNYFKLTKTCPMAAGLMHDMFCQSFEDEQQQPDNATANTEKMKDS